MLENLRNYKIILASGSPRRKELLGDLDLDFIVRPVENADESYPKNLPTDDIALFIAGKKADAATKSIADDELIITADTIVVIGSQVLGKPKDPQGAKEMLRTLSGKTHKVITGVCLTTKNYSNRFP